MIRRNTWIALGLFIVALGGAIWWSRTGGPSEPEQTPTPTLEPVWSFSPEEIVAIQVESNEDGTVVRARRDESAGWVLEEPSAPYADSGRIERAASTLTSMRPASTLTADDLSAFGLESPQFQISIDLQDGSTQVLQIGRQAPTGTYTYAKLPFNDQVLFLQTFSVQDVTGLLDPLPIATATATLVPTPASTEPAPEATPTP